MKQKNVSVPRFYRSSYVNNLGVRVPLSTISWHTGVSSYLGSQNPGWEDMVRKHLNATTPLNAVWYSAKYRAYYFQATNISKHILAKQERQTTLGTINNSLPSFAVPPAFSGIHFTTARNNAISKLYDFIRKTESRANIGEDLGEISQTYRMASRPMSGILDLATYSTANHIKALKAFKWNTVKQTARALAKVALEYRFGIQPLIRSAADAYVSIGNRDEIAYYVDFDVSGTGAGLTAPPDTTRVNVQLVLIQANRIRSDRFKVRYRGQYKIASTVDKVSLARSLGLTWREAPTTLYNIAPYSFLLDYVVNLNQFVEALAVPWNNVAWCNLTEMATHSEMTNSYPVDVDNSASIMMRNTFVQPSFATLDSHRVQRSVVYKLPMPWLQVKIPNLRQRQNVLALLASRLPVINNLTRAALRSKNGPKLEQAFRLQVRHTIPKVPYPSFTF